MHVIMSGSAATSTAARDFTDIDRISIVILAQTRKNLHSIHSFEICSLSLIACACALIKPIATRARMRKLHRSRKRLECHGHDQTMHLRLI